MKPTGESAAAPVAEEKGALMPGEGGGLPSRDFILQSTQDDYELACRLLLCPGWPQSCSPLAKAFELVKEVGARQERDQNGPVVIVDRWVLRSRRRSALIRIVRISRFSNSSLE